MPVREHILILCIQLTILYSFGHRSDIVDIDAANQDTFLSCGFDKQAILWKTKHGS